MWFDEAASWHLANMPVSKIIELAKIDNTPPLYHILLHFWLKTGVASDFMVRFPAMIFGLLAVFMTFKLGKLLFDRRIALMTALLGALSFHLLHYSQENRMYSLQLLLALVHIYYFIKGMRQGKPLHWAGWLFSGILMYYNHLFAVFLFMAEWVYYFLSLRQYSHRLKVWLGINLLLLIACLPWAPVILRQMGEIQEKYWVQPVSPAQLVKMAVQLSGGTDFSGKHLLALILNLPFWIPAVIGGVKLVKSDIKDKLLPITLFLCPLIIVLIISLSGKSLFFFRYFVFLIPLYQFVIVYGFFEGFKGLLRSVSIAGFFFVIALFVFAYYYDTNFSEPQRLRTREVVEHIRKEAGENDIILHIAIHDYGLETFFVSTRYNRGRFKEFLWRRMPPPFYFGRQFLPEGSMISDIGRIVNAPRIWVLSQAEKRLELIPGQLPTLPPEKNEVMRQKYGLTLEKLWKGLIENGYSLKSSGRFERIVLYELVKS